MLCLSQKSAFVWFFDELQKVNSKIVMEPIALVTFEYMLVLLKGSTLYTISVSNNNYSISLLFVDYVLEM